MDQVKQKSVALIVAHPDDETLWAGGTILSHPSWKCFVVCLCRGSDTDRAPKFYKVLEILNAEGIMGDLDDGPEQRPLAEKEVETAILSLLPPTHFDLIITHNPKGEYTKHLRHEEISKAVKILWNNGKIHANQLWTFAYNDDHGKCYPKAEKKATIYKTLTKHIWLRKYSLITEIYGFKKDSWEAQSTTHSEAFQTFTEETDAQKWLNQLITENNDESISIV